MHDNCVLCLGESENILWYGVGCRVVAVAERNYPGFCRVIWNRHVREMTDLSPMDRSHFMDVVFATEDALRQALRPDKINLASLGNQVPHLHWHVVPRFRDDAHFPDAIWSSAKRVGAERKADFQLIQERLSIALKQHGAERR